ncbi:HSP70-domain-containing protein [Piromyces finnis]|uniref:HSP70-domain-containing protein n=1 Tax=Piromyces finnis TaxID=1754191 RepID=A0A1Y1UYB0_9FUNG|nr:HSP70-domain-containing protein [Piromyces finnis]|eukprot:ORX42764.1 HSP70-domain-containing protein [Piromyces finnis]
MTKKNFVIGIDFGTTEIRVGIWENNHVEVIEIYFNRSMPSYVSFCENVRLFGKEAFDKARIKPENTIYGVKRFIGRSFEEIQNKLNYLTFNVTEENGKPYFKINYKNEEMLLTPDEIYVMLISKIKSIVEDYLNKTITDAVISVPANFNDSQRRATLDAGKLAGLNVLRIINEPTAAAINYVLNNNTKNQKILIADLGGGTFDVSIIDIQNGSSFKVMATGGDTHLGGEDLTNNLVGYLIGEIKREYQIDISTNRKSLLKLRNACEKAKCNLTSFKDTIINVEDLFQEEPFDFSKKITRSEFKELNASLFDRIKEILDRVVKDSGLKTSDVDELVIVGGSTRIPIIQEIISSYFNGKPINKTVNLDEAVVNGATIQAAILSGNALDSLQNFTLSEIIPYSLSVKTKNGYKSTIIKRNSTIPTENNKHFTVDYNPQNKSMFLSYSIYEGSLLNSINSFPIKEPSSCIINIFINLYIDENGILTVDIYKGRVIRDIKKENIKLLNTEENSIKSNLKMFDSDEMIEKDRIKSMSSLQELAIGIRKKFKTERIIDQHISKNIQNLNDAITELIVGNLSNNEACQKKIMQHLELIKFNDLKEEKDLYPNHLGIDLLVLQRILFQKEKVNKIITDYKNYIIDLCSSEINFVNYNYNASKEEYEKHKKNIEDSIKLCNDNYDVRCEIIEIIDTINNAESITDEEGSLKEEETIESNIHIIEMDDNIDDTRKEEDHSKYITEEGEKSLAIKSVESNQHLHQIDKNTINRDEYIISIYDENNDNDINNTLNTKNSSNYAITKSQDTNKKETLIKKVLKKIKSILKISDKKPKNLSKKKRLSKNIIKTIRRRIL